MELIIPKTYVEFICQGFCLSKNRIQEVKNRDTDLPNNIRIPQNAYGFRFFDVYIIDIRHKGEKIRFKSEQMDFSINYYMSDGVYTLEEFRQAFPNEKEMIHFLQVSGCKEIAQCRTGNFVPLTEEDEIVEPV